MPRLNKLFSRKQINEFKAQLIADHGNKCAICNKPREAFKNALALDHNHRSGQLRGLLCYRCNKFVVGRHSLESAKALYEYLLKYDPKGG